MALIGITLALASISLLLYRVKASLTFSRAWPFFPRLEKAKLQLDDEPLHTNAISSSNGANTNKPSTLHSSRVQPARENASSLKSNASSIPEIMHTPDQTDLAAPDSPNKTPTKPSKPQPDAQLMPPPPLPVKPASKPPTTNTLRVPTTGPLPNRGPPTATNTTSARPQTLTPATSSTLPAGARPRKKVLLAPGHSPLDWAQLTRTAPPYRLAGVPCPQRITPSQLARANGRRGAPAWSSYRGRVYNVGAYLPYHPGGPGELMRAAGRDGQALFEEVHAWVNWENMLGACLVGFLVGEEEEGEGKDDMEGLD